MDDATQCLESSQAGAKKFMKSAKSCKPSHRFTPGIEWEVLHTDAVLLLGLTHALRCATRPQLSIWHSLLILSSAVSRIKDTYSVCQLFVILCTCCVTETSTDTSLIGKPFRMTIRTSPWVDIHTSAHSKFTKYIVFNERPCVRLC